MADIFFFYIFSCSRLKPTVFLVRNFYCVRLSKHIQLLVHFLDAFLRRRRKKKRTSRRNCFSDKDGTLKMGNECNSTTTTTTKLFHKPALIVIEKRKKKIRRFLKNLLNFNGHTEDLALQSNETLIFFVGSYLKCLKICGTAVIWSSGKYSLL